MNTFKVFTSVTNTLKVSGGIYMDMRSVSHQVKVQEWREIISRCRNSGMPVREWCSNNGIKPGQYYYWLRVIRNESLALIPREPQAVQPSFAAVKVSEMNNTDTDEAGICAVVKTSSFSIEIKNTANPKTLEQILQVLNSLC